jgi:GWxTD domain-containing protein
MIVLRLVLPALLLVVTAPRLASAQSLPALFHKAKAEVKRGAWQEALDTLDVLEAEAGKPGNENASRQLAAPLAFYRGVCDANLGRADEARSRFETFLAIQPNASIDPGTYSKKAVAAFEEARKAKQPPEAGGQRSSTLFRAYQEFRPPANISDLSDERWADGPVRWILTSEEKQEWSQLSTGGEREQFVEKFWERRNPHSGSSDNTYRTSFERRAAFADEHFREGEEQRGSLTDRGMVFVLLGPPTWAGRKPLQAGDDQSDPQGMTTYNDREYDVVPIPFRKTQNFVRGWAGAGLNGLEAAANYREVWHYRKELLPKGISYLQVDFEFITKQGYGSNILQRESTVLSTLGAAGKPPSAADPPAGAR